MKQSVSRLLTVVLCLALSISGAVVVVATAVATGTGTWSQLPLSEGNVYSIGINPDTPTTLYAGTNGGGVFRSTDSGASWAAANSGLTSTDVRSFAINPDTPTTLYAGTIGNGVFRSVNSGDQWIAVNTGLTNTYVRCLAIDPLTPAILYAGTHSGVFRSVNSGDQWTAVNAGLTSTPVLALAIDPLIPSTLYAGTSTGGIFRSVDSGATWTAANTGLTTPCVYALAIDPLIPAVLYAGTWGNGVFRSTDGSATWTSVNLGLTSEFVYGLAIDPLTPSSLYVGTSGGGVSRSVDGGTTWTAMNTGLTGQQDILSLAINPLAPSILYAGTGAGVFRYDTVSSYALTTTTSPLAGGSVTKFPDQASYLSGTSVTLTAIPAPGYHLVSFTDNGHAVSPLPSPAYVISSVTEDHAIGAVFAEDGVTDTVTIAYEGYPENLFPLISDSAYTAFAANFLMANPVGITPRGELYADLCSTVPTLENGDLVRNIDGTVTTTVRLRPGLKWSDGQPLTIDDYIFSHKLYVAPAVNTIARSPMDLVTSIERLDDLTCRVTWSSWSPYIPCGWSIYPEHLLGPIFDADPAGINTCDYAQNPIHAGPYVLESRVEGQFLTFVANPFYWQPGKPLIPTVVVRIVGGTNDLIALMASGAIDVSSESLTLELAQEFEETYGTSFNVYYNEANSPVGIMKWNLTSPWFTDKRVRQAFYYGIDRTLVTQLTKVGTEAVMSPLVSDSTYATRVLDAYAYNPDTANALLDAAGWTWNTAHTERILPNGSPAVLKIRYSQGATFREHEVNLIKPMLALLGITVQHDPMDFNTMLDTCTYGTFTVALHGIGFDNYDVFQSVQQFHGTQIPTEANGWAGQNVSRYSNPDMDGWLTIAEGATDPVVLTEAYAHIQAIFAEDLPCFYLEQRVYPDVVRKGLLGYDHFVSSGAYCNWNIQDWSWSPGAVLGLSPVVAAHEATVTVPLTVNITSANVADLHLTVTSSDPAYVALTDITAGDLSGAYTLDPATGTIGWTSPTGVTGFHTIAYLTFNGIGTFGGGSATVAVGAGSGDLLADETASGIPWSPVAVSAFIGHTLSVDIVGSGSVAKFPDQVAYLPGTVVWLTATPALGYTFTGWSGDLAGTTNPTTITMNANKTVTATFASSSASFTLPLLPSWNVIAVPFATPVSLLPTCDLFLSWDGSLWQMTTTLLPGTGYLVRNTAGATTVPLTGTPSSSPQTQPATGTWQIIGNPYTTPASVACTSSVPYLLSWDGSLWQLVSPTNLPPGLGFLLQSSSPGTITLTRLP